MFREVEGQQRLLKILSKLLLQINLEILRFQICKFRWFDTSE